MKKLKSNDDTLDRLSDLPDSLIHEIFSFLEMRDVVQTTLLSKRWKYLWITTPCLLFDELESDVEQFRNFVYRVLMLWRGTRLRRFVISNQQNLDELDADANLWFLFATERKVEELDIYGFFPPRCLYECSSIRKLEISNNYYLETYGNVQWDRLNTLKLSNCVFSQHWMNLVLSSSPQLETLIYIKDQYDEESSYNNYLANEESENLSIRSSSLKKLSIETYYDESSVLSIWAPNLEALEFLGGSYSGYLLTNTASLTKVYIVLKGFYSSRAIAEEAISKILLAIQHVETITLSAHCFKMLGVMIDKYSVSPLLNVKLLKIEYSVAGVSELLCLLEIFPKLKMLIIDWGYDRNLFKFDAGNNILSEANILQSNLLLLKTVKIYLSGFNASLFQFLEFLLEHAAMIEKIVIQLSRSVVDNSENMILAEEKVVSLQRSFPSVEMIIC